MRRPCSDAERETIERLAARLGEAGYDVVIEEFASRRSQAPWLAAYAALAALAAVLVYPAPLLAAVAGAAAVVLHARDSEGRPLVRRWTGTSYNAIARPPDAGAPRLVALTHADSVPLRRNRGLVVALQTLMAAVPAAGAAAWVAEAGTELPRAVGGTGLVTGGAIAAAAIALYRGSPAPPHGDSALEALFELAVELRPGPAWFVVTGSRTAGSLGIQSFLAAHGHEVAGVAWLNLEPAAMPEATAVSEEGTWRERRADRVLMGAAEEAGAEIRPYRAVPTDATVLLARRRRALTVTVPPDRAGAVRIARAVAAVALHRRG